MRITVKLFASLREGRFESRELGMEEGADVRRVAQEIGLPPEEQLIIFLNNRHAESDTPLSEGDRLSIFPLVGGG